ncbi:MAG: hypothetical protein FWG07_03575 [Treponema sp.]|nr:hypothetical protein [Treponema sp.]
MTKQRYKTCLCAVLVFVSSYLVLAQSPHDSLWRLPNSEGVIIIIVEGRRTVYQNGFSAAQGVMLGGGDMVQTGKGTAELHFITDSSVMVKLSENTSVIINEFAGEISLGLLYGKIRVHSNTAISINTGNSACFFRDCDAELDYIIRPGFPQPALIVHCFSGDGELTVNATSEAEGARFSVRSNEILSLEYRTPFFYVERKNMETLSGQEGNSTTAEPDFDRIYSTEQVTANGTFSPQSPGESPELLRESMDNVANSSGKSLSIKKGSLITGLVLIGAGAAVQGYYHLGDPKPEFKNGLLYGSLGSMGLGTVFLISAFINKSPGK